MSPYAQNTTVSVSRSKAEIERTLRRYGVSRFGTMEEFDTRRGIVQFEFNNLKVQMIVPLPDPHDEQFTRTPTSGKQRSQDAADKAYEQAVKQRWRALLLAIKAKLEAVDTGISSLEQEFMPFILFPDGTSVGDRLLPQIQAAAKAGTMPTQLALPLTSSHLDK